MCLSNKQKVNTVECSDCESDSESFFVGSVVRKNENKSTESEWYVEGIVYNQSINFKTDSGAQCNVLSKQLCAKAGIKNIKKTRAKLVLYSGHQIETVGRVDIAISINGKYHVTEVQVVENETVPVPGLQSSIEMGLVKRICSTEKVNPLDDLKDETTLYFKVLAVYLVNTKLKLMKQYHQ